MISYDYMISPRAFQIGILIIFFFRFFLLFLFSFLPSSLVSPVGVQGHPGLLTKHNVGRHSNRLYHVVAHLCGVLDVSKRRTQTHVIVHFWGVLVLFFLSRMLHNYRRKVLSVLFALLDRVRCATCVSNSRVALWPALFAPLSFLFSYISTKVPSSYSSSSRDKSKC